MGVKLLIVASMLSLVAAQPATPIRDWEPRKAAAGDAELASSKDPDFEAFSARIAERVLTRPEYADPMEYAVTVQYLWERGDRARAYFWYQVFMARTAVLVNVASVSRDEDDENEYEIPLMLRLSGMEVLQWALSDPDMAEAVARRAFEYEAKLPAPPYVSAALWLAHSGEARKDLMRSLDGAFDGVSATRRKARAYIGPWLDPGSPLDEAWR
jgi:hypothetical protein